jgi:hypothetical protein
VDALHAYCLAQESVWVHVPGWLVYVWAWLRRAQDMCDRSSARHDNGCGLVPRPQLLLVTPLRSVCWLRPPPLTVQCIQQLTLPIEARAIKHLWAIVAMRAQAFLAVLCAGSGMSAGIVKYHFVPRDQIWEVAFSFVHRHRQGWVGRALGTKAPIAAVTFAVSFQEGLAGTFAMHRTACHGKSMSLTCWLPPTCVSLRAT